MKTATVLLSTLIESLTPREREVCALLIRGFSNKEIASLSNTAASTVKLHRSRILKKMDVVSLSGLMQLFEDTPEGRTLLLKR